MTLREVTRIVISLVEKGATHVLMPISARKQLNDLPDDVLTKVTFFITAITGRVDKELGGIKVGSKPLAIENRIYHSYFGPAQTSRCSP